MSDQTEVRREDGGPYASLRAVLDEAFAQSAHGKGKARHANDRPFEQQPILEIGRMVGPGFALGQVMKKAQESRGMLERGEVDAASAELLGAIVYAASVVVLAREGIGRRRGGDAAAELTELEAAYEKALVHIEDTLGLQPKWVAAPEMSPSVTPAESDKLQIEAGKFYRMRAGGVTGPMRKDERNTPYDWTDGKETWLPDGFYMEGNYGPSCMDLVAEAPAPDTN